VAVQTSHGIVHVLAGQSLLVSPDGTPGAVNKLSPEDIQGDDWLTFNDKCDVGQDPNCVQSGIAAAGAVTSNTGSPTPSPTPTGGPGAPAAPAGPGGPPPDTTPPDTNITSGPAGTVEDTQATFTFSSNEGNATFECAKDTGAFLACESPKTYYGFGDGLHTFRVRAIDAAGNPDPSAASREWTVRKPVTTTQPPTTATTSPSTTNTSAPPANNTPTAPPPSGGGGITLPPAKGTNTTAKPTTTTAKPAKGGGAGSAHATSTTEAAEAAPPPPAPVGDLPGALVLTGPGASGDFQAASPQGNNPVVGEVNKRPKRNTAVLIGMGVAAGLILIGSGGVLWWRRPGRYIPA
jgi:hypothetical protein